jgi:outer membrane lipoprotein-sorting protein
MQPSLDVTAIIEKIDSVYGDRETVQGHFERSNQLGKHKEVVRGRFFYRRPALVRIDNLEPSEQSLISDGKELWFFNPIKEVAARKAFSPTEGQVMSAGIEGIAQHNPFQLLADGYHCERIDDFDGHLVVSCSPPGGSQTISSVLVKVNPQNWTVSAYEVFDKNGSLVSQTKFLDMRRVDAFWFPARTETRVSLGEGLAQETVTYSRVRINEPIDDGLFAFTPSENIRVIEAQEPTQGRGVHRKGGAYGIP